VEAAGRGTRGAHIKHAAHVRDVGRVEAQRLVECRRALPSRKVKHTKRGDRRAGTREGVGAAAAQAGCRHRTQLWGLLAGARAERTSNMRIMAVTLDVSKLSGWLNADACCRVERESIKERRQAGRDARGSGGGSGASRVQAEDPSAEAAGRGKRRAHIKHVAHVRDSGRVEAQRLVERRRALPSRKGKHKQSGDRRAGTREGVGKAAAQAACRQRTRLWRLLAGARAERT